MYPQMHVLFSDSSLGIKDALVLLPEGQRYRVSKGRGGLYLGHWDLQTGLMPANFSQLRLGCIYLERNEESIH